MFRDVRVLVKVAGVAEAAYAGEVREHALPVASRLRRKDVIP